MSAATEPRTTTTWDLDTSHSTIGFSVRHLVIAKVRGQFSRWTGTITTDEARPENSLVEVNIEAGSIDTHEAKRDGHLRSADFLNTDQYPAITFASTKVESAGASQLRLTGDLTIAGVTKPVTLEVEVLGRAKDPWGGERAVFAAKTAIDRTAFGLTWNQALEAGGVLVGDEVTIELEVSLIKQA